MTQLTNQTNWTKLIHSSQRLLCCCLFTLWSQSCFTSAAAYSFVKTNRSLPTICGFVWCCSVLNFSFSYYESSKIWAFGRVFSLLKTFNKVMDLCSWCRIVLRTSRYILNQTILRIVYFIISSSEIPLLKLIVVIAVPLKWMHKSPPVYWTATLSSVALIGCV